jgi:flavin-binding protein dodecin
LEVKSKTNIEDAAQKAVADASKTIRNIKSVYIEVQCVVENNKITQYRVIAKITFEVEGRALG